MQKRRNYTEGLAVKWKKSQFRWKKAYDIRQERCPLSEPSLPRHGGEDAPEKTKKNIFKKRRGVGGFQRKGFLISNTPFLKG